MLDYVPLKKYVGIFSSEYDYVDMKGNQVKMK